MSDLLFEIIKLSITGSYVFLFVVLIRLLIRKAPKAFSYYLWFVFWIRMIVPNSISSVFSIFNYTGITPEKAAGNFENIVYPQLISIDGGGNAANVTAEMQNGTVEIAKSTNIFETVLVVAWIAGIAFIAIYSLVIYMKLRHNMHNSYRHKDNVYINKNVDSPFVLGLIKPRIYMPDGLGEHEFKYILMHEQVHIKRHDHIVKILCYMVLALHWFNPLAWIAFILMSKDIEISCDEQVIKRLGTGIKKEYSYSLLNMSLKEELAPVPIAFGQSNAKERIKRVMNYKKTQPIIIIMIAIILAASGCALLSNPIASTNDTLPLEYDPDDVTVDAAPVEVIIEDEISEYEGLSGVELYNAVMTGNYGEKIMYTREISNEDEERSITTYRYDGNYKELQSSDYEEPYSYLYITIYVDDELTAYSYAENSKTGDLYKYDKSEDAHYNSPFLPMSAEDADSLVQSKIIDFNGRETYYYEIYSEFTAADNSFTDTYLQKYWRDTETKVEMKSEFYMNDSLVSNSVVTEISDEFEITDDFFLPPSDVEFIDIEANVGGQ